MLLVPPKFILTSQCSVLTWACSVDFTF
uniref:Uncharacterized protein n=1 Tax=Arundo donax TaxID=35708 RepID=A0A0A9HST2_ARUDO